MHVVVYKGRVKQLGPGVSDMTHRLASMEYAYVELVDGTIVRSVSVVGGLDGKLTTAVEEDGDVELHVLEGGKKGNVLLAIRMRDGKTFASDVRQGRGTMYALVAVLTVLGVATIPFLGLGFVFLWFAWRMWKAMRGLEGAGEHVSALPNVIVV